MTCRVNWVGVEAPEVLHGDWSPACGYAAGAVLAKRALAQADVAAVFVANDQMALGVLRAMHENGRSVPSDVSIVGFDDIPEAAHFWPPLTTIRQDFAEIGRRSVDLLLAELGVGGQRHAEPIQPVLVLRTSTSAPGGRA